MVGNKHKKRLVLFDAHAILHRAYHALPDFTSRQGEPTGGLYGLASMLIRIIDDLQPDYLAACYDLPEPTFRKQAYEGYKSGRKKTDDALVEQIKRSRDVFTAFNIPIYEYPGFEADDIIGTLVEQTKKETNLQVVIASGDMDTLQLVVDEKVIVYTLKKGITDTVVYDENKVKERFGFAPKFLIDYKGLRGDPSDNIIGISGIGEKTATVLIDKFGSIETIYKKLKKNEDEFLTAGLKPRIINLLKENEEEALFSKTLATIRLDAPVKFSLPDQDWRSGLTWSEIESLFEVLDFKSLLVRAKGVFADNSDQGRIIEEKIDPLEVRRVGIALWLVDSDKTTPTLEDIYQFGGQSDFAAAKKAIFDELKKRDLESVYRDIELPIIPILEQAKNRGVLIDLEHLRSLSKKHHQKLKELETEIHRQAGREFNISSPKQLGEILFDQLKLTAVGLKKTAGGARSTRESELIKLKDCHPIIELILKHRELSKLLSTYIDNLPDLVDKHNRLHTSLNQAGTTTGRMSSSNPNLQNIPVRDGVGREIRRAFIATSGSVWVAADYSQVEMRVLALLSGDESLLQIFKAGKDVHSGVASLVFGVAENEVTKDMRRQAKVINFGIIYGMGVNALKQNLGTNRSEAQKFYDDFFNTFPKIKNYFDQVISDAYAKGYTETFFGRRRYFPALRSRLPYIRAQAERMAMNAPLQGTAADMVKIAMKKIDQALREGDLINQCHFLLQIHDELIYEVEIDKEAEARQVIKASMENVLTEQIPFTVEVSSGPNWGELKK